MMRGPNLNGWLTAVAIAGMSLTGAWEARAAGFGVKGGVGLLQKDDLIYGGTTTGKALWMVGGYVDVGGVASSRLRITPALEYSSRSGTKVTSVSLEGRFQFFRGPKAVVYAGMGPGINVKKVTSRDITGALRTDRVTQGTLNVPFGVEWKLGGGGLRWIFEMKMAIADSQTDSAYRIGTGFGFSLK